MSDESGPETGPRARGADLDRLVALEEQRDFLLRSIRDLDREAAAGDLEVDDHHTLRDDYTARAAAVIRSIHAGRALLAHPPTRSRWRRVRAALLVVTVAAALGVAVAQSSGQRSVGEVATGSIRQTTSDMLAQARLAMSTGDAVGAVERYDGVLRTDPVNREALAYKGWLLVLAGLVPDGAQLIDEAVAADPLYPDARFFRAFVRARHLDDPRGALDDARAFLANDPPPSMVPDVVALVDELEPVGTPDEP